MTETQTGGCLCGKVRFEFKGPIETAGACHCTDCRRITGSAYGVSFPVSTEGDFTLHGEASSYEKTGDSGNAITRWFCNSCGAPLYTTSPVHPDKIYIKAGALDEPSAVKIDRQTWLVSKVAWADLPPDTMNYDKGRR